MRWGGVKRRLLGWGIMCALAAVTGSVRIHAVPRTHFQFQAPPLGQPTEAAAASGFRLGTAGRPFAWSTAIGDLNADGRPDFAIADRVGRGIDGFEYAIELSIAGGRSESVEFDSDLDALNITLRDVDRDRDLDVVVTGAVSRSIVAVWLNDGAGQFHRVAPAAYSTTWIAASSSLTDSPSPDSALSESIGRTGVDGLPVDRVCGSVCLSTSTLVTCGPFRTARASLSAFRPRAPPLALQG